MPVPKKEDVIQKIRQNLPQELLTQPIWIPFYYKPKGDGTFTKPPVKGFTVKEDEPGLTFEECIKHGYPGIKINKWNNYVAFDIDDTMAKHGHRKFDINNLHPKFKEFIADKDSYMELSPSGCGLRILFKIDSKKDLPGRANLLEEFCIGGELFTNSGYVTITGDYISGSGLTMLTRKDLVPWFEQTKIIDLPRNRVSLPSMGDVVSALNACKLNQSDQVKRAYTTITGQDYSHYEYWIKIMAACHDYATQSGQNKDMLMHVIEWCQQDAAAFESDDDVITHWLSFTDGDNRITYHTLFKMANLMKFQWPREMFKKDEPTGRPMPLEYVNFEYLMNYYNIQVFHEPYNDSIFVSGDDDVIDKYFKTPTTHLLFGRVGPFDKDDLTGCMWELMQDNKYYNLAYSTAIPLTRRFVKQTNQDTDMLALWLNTPHSDLPEDVVEEDTDPALSNLDYLMSCIQFSGQQNMELARLYLDAFFFSVVMPVYNTKRMYADHSFMLIITGPEACRKSTFASNLMPKQFQPIFISHTTESLAPGKSQRDFIKEMGCNAILIVDEFEIFFNKGNASLFKNLVTADTINSTPIYQTRSVPMIRRAALLGTTNQRELPIEVNSSRRIAMLDIKWVDTDALAKINWHTFYREYVKRGVAALKQGRHIWKLTKDQLTVQYQENERHRSKTELELAIDECILNYEDNPISLEEISSIQSVHPQLYKLSDIKGMLLQVHGPRLYYSLPALKNTLKRLCGKYTETIGSKQSLPSCEGSIEDGILKQGQHVRYALPPRKTDFEEAGSML